MNTKVKLILFVLITGGLLFFLVKPKIYVKQPTQSSPQPSKTTNNNSPMIISTKPDPLEDTIISADQIIEVTFNRPLENKGEFKLRIEPKIEFKIELSQDRKTAKIMPQKPYELGTTYTIFIGPDSKFDGVGAWGQEKIYHFKTIRYTGV